MEEVRQQLRAAALSGRQPDRGGLEDRLLASFGIHLEDSTGGASYKRGEGTRALMNVYVLMIVCDSLCVYECVRVLVSVHACEFLCACLPAFALYRFSKIG